MPVNKKCLVSFSSTGREFYNKALLRQIRSFVEGGWDGDFMMRSLDGYCDEYLGIPIKVGSWPNNHKYGLSPAHADIPYLFKAFLLQEAIEAGYTKLLWCDSTIIKVGNLDPIFEHAAKHGVCAFDNLGFPLIYWIHDAAMNRLGLKETDLEGMKQIMACAVAFDIEHPVGNEILYQWIEKGLDGVSFNMRDFGSKRKGYRGHQGDQPVLSALLNIHSVPILDYGGLCYEPHDATKEYGQPMLVNKGIL